MEFLTGKLSGCPRLEKSARRKFIAVNYSLELLPSKRSADLMC